MDPFQQRKAQTVAGLQDAEADKSRKGSVDSRIVGLVAVINRHDDVFTTSSCSGRITVFADPTAATRASGKKGGEWVFATHDTADEDIVIGKVKDKLSSGARFILRFEPFILAAECRSVEVGRHMLAVARQSGFRESGLHIAERVILSVRCSLRLEVPIADEARQLVTDEYIRYLVKLGNEKMLINWQRVERLEALMTEALGKPFPVGRKQGGTKSTRSMERMQGEGSSCSVEERGGVNSKNSGHKTKKSKQKNRPARKMAVPLQPMAAPESSEEAPTLMRPEVTLKTRQEAMLTRLQEAEGKLAQRMAEGGSPGLSWIPLAATVDDQGAGVPAGGPKCWGHSASLIGSTIVVFGGYGGAGQHARNNDIALYDTQLGVWKQVKPVGDVVPRARTGHSAVAIGQKLLIIGGRTHPQCPLADVFVLNLETCSWTALQCQSQQGSPRWQGRFGHSAVAVGDDLLTLKVFVFGGKGPGGVLSDEVWLLQQAEVGNSGALGKRQDTPAHNSHSRPAAVWTWCKLTCTGAIPAPRKSHAACLATDNQHMLVYGGIGPAYGTYYNSLHSLNLQNMQWTLLMGCSSSVQELRPQWDLSSGPTRPDPMGQDDGSIQAAPSTQHLSTLHDAPSSHLSALHDAPSSQHLSTVHDAPSLEHLNVLHDAPSAQPLEAANRHSSETFFQPPPSSVPDFQSTETTSATSAIPTVGDVGAGGAAHWASTPDSPACFSHTLTSVAGTDLLLRYGGCPAAAQQSMHVIDWRRKLCWKVELPFPRDLVAMRHDAVLAGTTLYSIGGGAFCFSFGTVFSSNFSLDLRLMLDSLSSAVTAPIGNASPSAHSQSDTLPPSQNAQHTLRGLERPVGRSREAAQGVGAPGQRDVVVGPLQDSTIRAAMGVSRALPADAAATSPPTRDPPSSDMVSVVEPRGTEGVDQRQAAVAGRLHNDGATEGGTYVLKVNKKSAKGVKDALKVLGWLERSIKTSSAAADPDRVALPLKPAAIAQLQVSNTSLPTELLEALQAGAQVVQIAEGAITASQKYQAAQGPAVQLHSAVTQLLTDNLHLAQEAVQQLCAELPSKWEKLGDLVLIPANSMRSPEWEQCGPELWQTVAIALQAQRVARQAPVASTGTRDSQAHLLLGDSGWVTHRESGVTFTLDVTCCMFSSGNVTERMRMGNVHCKGETVLDLYTGIGYYTLPLLVKGGVEKVYACEWNPNAVEALRRNLEVNGVSGRCEVREGDCRLVAPREPMCDRVLLGLLPSSQGGWATAIAALKNQGGWLHIHENVRDTEEKQFVVHTVEKLQQLAVSQGRDFSFHMRHVERVKWYAPHIRHIVMDVEVKCPHNTNAARVAQMVVEATNPHNVNAASGEQMLASATQNPAPFPVQGTGLTEPDSLDGNRVSLGAKGNEADEQQVSSIQPQGIEGATTDDPIRQWAAGVSATFPISDTIPFLDATHLTIQQFHDIISPLRVPVILKGLDLGPAPHKWSPEYLMSSAKAKETLVSCHVCREESGAMDFTNKNFSFKVMTLEELVGRAAGVGRWADAMPLTDGEGAEKYYLRSLGENPRKEPSDISKVFPELAKDLKLPPFVPHGSEFSTVLRVTSKGLRLWTHYDVMDNFLLQVTGSKKVLMWPPSDEDNLYITGSSSPIVHLEEPDLKQYPKFQQARARSCTLAAGDVLFIPSLWFHNVLSTSFSVGVNMFWRHLPQSFYERKDLYGNKDLVAYNAAAYLATKIGQVLAALPDHYLQFYKQRIVRQIEGCTSVGAQPSTTDGK